MIFNQFSKTMRKVSIRGRYALALRGCELLVEKIIGSQEKDIDFFKTAWKFTSEKYLSVWEAEMGDYFEYDFNNSDINKVTQWTLDITSVHAYGSIDNDGETHIVNLLWGTLEILYKYRILLEDINQLRKFSPYFSLCLIFRDQIGWGKEFSREKRNQ